MLVYCISKVAEHGFIQNQNGCFVQSVKMPLARRTFILPRSFPTLSSCLPSLHQLLYRLSRDNLKHFYLSNLFHHFNLLSHIFVPCPRSYLAYAMLISTFYYYYTTLGPLSKLGLRQDISLHLLLPVYTMFHLFLK